MAEANSVHSTPPTNTSAIDPTRRRFLTVAAGGAVAAAIPTAALTTAPAIDPIYAVISVHRNSHIAHIASLELQTRFERRYGIGKGGWISTKPCHDEDDAFMALVASRRQQCRGSSQSWLTSTSWPASLKPSGWSVNARRPRYSFRASLRPSKISGCRHELRDHSAFHILAANPPRERQATPRRSYCDRQPRSYAKAAAARRKAGAPAAGNRNRQKFPNPDRAPPVCAERVAASR
jgi:hypothetical protein